MSANIPAKNSRQRVLHEPGFVAFLGARLAAVFSAQILLVVIAWQVYETTRDPMSLAWVGLAQFLPMALLLLPAGELADRFNRKRILLLSWGGQALCAGLLLYFSLQQMPVSYYYAALALFGSCRAFTSPTLQSLLPQIVPRNQLPQAVALNSMIMEVAVIGGPLLGGILYALGGSLAYAVCLASLIVGMLFMLRVPLRYATKLAPITNSAWQRFTAGIGYIRSRPIILGAISLDLFAVLLGSVVALLPIYAIEILNVGPEGLGALRSAIAIGALLMGIYLSAQPLGNRVGRILFIAVAVFGVANLVFAISTIFWVSFVAMLIAGAADMISVNIRSTLIQLATPDEMRGRVNAVNTLFIGSSNELGDARAGAVAAWVGAVPAAVLGGVATLGVVGAWMWGFKPLRKVDRFGDVEPERRPQSAE